MPTMTELVRSRAAEKKDRDCDLWLGRERFGIHIKQQYGCQPCLAGDQDETGKVEFLICGQTCSCSISRITTKNVPFNCRFPGDRCVC